MEPAFGWATLAPKALERARKQMLGGLGVRDEVGFLLLHQRYADRFFPGTSVLHTRLRYAVFVPWQFEDQAARGPALAERALKSAEVELARRLKLGEQPNIIGGQVWPEPADQPPSTVYWSALGAWGILRSDARGRTPTRRAVHGRLHLQGRTVDDDGEPLQGYEPPFVRLPARPAGWNTTEPLTFDLSAEEALFLHDRLSQIAAPGLDGRPSLLSRLVRENIAPPSTLWASAVARVAGPDAGPLRRARAIASLAAVGRGVYAALVETLREAADGRETPDLHRRHLRHLVKEHAARALILDENGLGRVESDVGALPDRLRTLLKATLEWLRNGDADPLTLQDVYAAAEGRKGTRARLAMTGDGRARRLEWNAGDHALGAPLHYRWDWVARLLTDLQEAQAA